MGRAGHVPFVSLARWSPLDGGFNINTVLLGETSLSLTARLRLLSGELMLTASGSQVLLGENTEQANPSRPPPLPCVLPRSARSD